MVPYIQQDENKRSVKFPCRLLANKEFFFCSFRYSNFELFFSSFLVIKNCKYSEGHLYLTTYVFWILLFFFLLFSCRYRSVHGNMVYYIERQYARPPACLYQVFQMFENKNMCLSYGWQEDVVIFMDDVFLCASLMYGNVNKTSSLKMDLFCYPKYFRID